MTRILQINSSLYSSGGQSSRLADAFVARLLDANPGAKLTLRDLAREPVPHLDAERFAAFTAKSEERNAAQDAVVEYSDAAEGLAIDDSSKQIALLGAQRAINRLVPEARLAA